MEIIIKGDAKEIAALVVEIQERQGVENKGHKINVETMFDSAILGQAIRGKAEEQTK